jgi:hypothetical protein
MFMPVRGVRNLNLSIFGVLVLWAYTAGAADVPTNRVERIYREARMNLDTQGTNSVESLWKFARACFDWAELAKTDGSRAQIAEEGIAAAREAIRRKYGSAPAHYYLAMDLGQLARTKSLGALKIVREMEVEFKEAIVLDEKFDYAGAHRSLGLLYKDAPGWPTSIGSRARARLHLRRANQLAPEYPDNRLSLAESYVEWGEPKTITDDMPSLEESLSDAKKKFTGEEWEASWRDWDVRFDRLKAKMAKPSDRAVTPRGKTK